VISKYLSPHSLEVRGTRKDLTESIRVQKEIADKVKFENNQKNIIYICGVDVAYRNNIAYCSAVLMNKNIIDITESTSTTSNITHPYVSGFLMLREADPIKNTLKLLKNPYDLLLVDGHGVLHPRHCGLASYVGVMLDTPTIGVAKSLLCGDIKKNNYIDLDGVASGFRMVKKGKKPIYISVGHKINLISAVRIIEQLVKPTERIPEPLRLAHIRSKTLANTTFVNKLY
jgi:deoxyribonuclease V